jgi:hypothetical protein
MTKREQIILSLMAKLYTVPGVAGRIYRSREDALSRDESPSIILYWDNERVEEIVTAGSDKFLSIIISVYQRGEVPDKLADPIVEAVHFAVMQDPSLGGTVIDLAEDGTSVDFSEADQDAVIIDMRYIVHYRHSRSNLAS